MTRRRAGTWSSISLTVSPIMCSGLRTTPATANIPVIVLSGGHFDQMTQDSLLREVCGHPGAFHVLRKAFDTQELFEVLQKFCGFEKEARRTP
jgi:CheY-like chemotaxis protein